MKWKKKYIYNIFVYFSTLGREKKIRKTRRWWKQQETETIATVKFHFFFFIIITRHYNTPIYTFFSSCPICTSHGSSASANKYTKSLPRACTILFVFSSSSFFVFFFSRVSFELHFMLTVIHWQYKKKETGARDNH